MNYKWIDPQEYAEADGISDIECIVRLNHRAIELKLKNWMVQELFPENRVEVKNWKPRYMLVELVEKDETTR